MLIMKIMKEKNNNEMCYMEEDELDIFLKSYVEWSCFNECFMDLLHGFINFNSNDPNIDLLQTMEFLRHV